MDPVQGLHVRTLSRLPGTGLRTPRHPAYRVGNVKLGAYADGVLLDAKDYDSRDAP
jgi:hypothetical protein